ncbi:MAG TPA: T9SS type A sorting domain-containing protein [Cyclobacteriaceae bacterium]|nr:T9SS type A sorting domain-containing protein [Cyclobacteriaceae bacterium]
MNGRACFAIITLLFFVFPAAAQSGLRCDGTRYLQPVFDSVNVTTVQFGKNKGPAGDSISLRMDVYQPAGDPAAARPALVLAFGGVFISGDRTQLRPLALEFARRGYVVSCIDYRIWPIFILGFPDSADIVDVSMKALGDMRAAVRFMKSKADQFRIDTSLVFVGGASSGSITAMTMAYMDPSDELPAYLQEAIELNGGLEGSSNNSTLSNSSKVRGVINLSGGLLDLSWLDEGEPVLASMHGTADDLVPYGYGLAAGLVYLNGSNLIHPALESKNIKNVLISVPGGGHSNIYSDPQYLSYADSLIHEAARLFYPIVCNEISTRFREQDIQATGFFPNPATDHFQLILKDNRPPKTIRLTDALGRMIEFPGTRSRIDFPPGRFSPGLYVLELIYEGNRRERGKVVIR